MSTTTILKLIIAAMAYFAPIQGIVHCVLIFILLDFLTGVYASYTKNKPIVSNRLRKTIEKFVFYTTAIVMGHIFTVEIVHWANLAQVIAGFIATTELISISENIFKITGLNIVKVIKETLSNKLKNGTKIRTKKKEF